jgi:nucleoside-diphosphate-sugar epimerase
MSRVLVTGPTGFIGAVLCESLTGAGYVVRAALRTDRPVPSAIAEKVIVGDIGSTSDWTAALEGVDAIIHTAACAHNLRDNLALANQYTETNVRGTQCLANAAARAQIHRFVYLSSVKVNGEGTSGRAYTAFDEPRPQDAYGISKWHAEQHVIRIAAGSTMQAVIVRSPLVYGPGVRANFLRLMRLVERGWPLPFGAVRNKRSLVNIWNLCDLLLHALRHQSAPARTWMASDGEDLSTPELLRRVGAAMGRRILLFPVPNEVLQLCAALVGRRAEIARLSNSLVIDISQTRADLGWSPPVTVDEALVRTVAWYLGEGRQRAA